jgi:hypothetical protein
VCGGGLCGEGGGDERGDGLWEVVWFGALEGRGSVPVLVVDYVAVSVVGT